MLQRIQSLWLLLAGIFAFLTVRLSIYNGTKVVKDVNEYNALNAGSSLFLLVFTVALGLISIITIFLYKNRGMQIKLCLAAMGVYIICCVLYFTQIKQFNVGALSLWSGLYFLIPILLILAMIGI
ncbi:MAG TPA: DUF4293 family protein, partial [Agriterribacter sp.]|nr:DUF4293 family protein [Agriterribacter sp.]